MDQVKIVSVTRAQYRMLGRMIRGEVLPLHRFRPEHATMIALHDKGCLAIRRDRDLEHPRGVWEMTPLGKRVHACRGCLRPGREVYDSASPEERQALGRVGTRYASSEDEKLAEGLAARMRKAGELS